MTNTDTPPPVRVSHDSPSGFTLIELSVVMVIIGLIIGAVISGQELINAAAVSAQITQINKYNSAAYTFRTKYGYLPGDITSKYATNYGFQARGSYDGEGDGNGVLAGNCANTSGSSSPLQIGCGEIAVFWQDLSTAGLIDLTVPTGSNYPNTAANPWPNITLITSPAVKNWLPTAKIGGGNYIYVSNLNGVNFFGLSKVVQIGWDVESTGINGSGIQSMTVQQAYNIDQKMDDGLPQSGNVTTCYIDYDVANGNAIWAAGKGNQGAGGGSAGSNCVPATSSAQTPYATTNCYDNNNVMGGIETYSITKNGTLPNCALSFVFQ